MKPFQTILLLAIIVLIGGMAALYWGKSIDTAVVVAPIETEETNTQNQEQEGSSIAPGSYLLYQVTTVADPGKLDWANDDTQQSVLYRLKLGEQTSEKILTVVRGPENPGGLTTSVFGQDLLMHRFSMEDGKERDGIASLEGIVTEQRPQRWGVLRSANGRYEVAYTSPYDYLGSEEDLDYQATVTDRETGVQKAMEGINLTGDAFLARWAEPFWIDDSGEYLLARELCFCEAPGLWEITVATGEIRRLDTLFGLEDNTAVVPIPGERKMFVTRSEKKEIPCAMGGCFISAPPSRLSLIDLVTNTETTLLSSETAAYQTPLVDSSEPGVFLISSVEQGSTWETYRLENPPVFDGALELPEDVWVVGYADGYLVYQGQDQALFVYDKASGTSTLLVDAPHDFVGIITVK